MLEVVDDTVSRKAILKVYTVSYTGFNPFSIICDEQLASRLQPSEKVVPADEEEEDDDDGIETGALIEGL